MIYYLDYENKKVYDNQDEFLDESRVYSGSYKKEKYCIFNDPQIGRNFETDPYIKVYDAFDQHSAKNVVRVSMRTGREVPTEHRNMNEDAGKGYLKYTKSVARFLKDAMDKPYKGNHSNIPDDVKTVYDVIYHEIMTTCKKPCIKYPIPDFEGGVE